QRRSPSPSTQWNAPSTKQSVEGPEDPGQVACHSRQSSRSAAQTFCLSVNSSVSPCRSARSTLLKFQRCKVSPLPLTTRGLPSDELMRKRLLGKESITLQPGRVQRSLPSRS